MLTIGILREGKVPPDARAPLSPSQCIEVMQQFPVQVIVQPSAVRSFQDAEYVALNVCRQEDLSACDILIGVKEVKPEELLPEKTYLFFSHTIKKQPHNRELLRAVLEKKIRLIDWEVLTDNHGDRLIAFGYYAGLVGAHNGLWTYGQRTGLFSLPRMSNCHDYAEVKAAYSEIQFPPVRIVLAGNGRVAKGAVRNLHDMGIHQVSPHDFLHKEFDHAVFTQLYPQDYVKHRGGPRIFNKDHFFANGDAYESIFAPYSRRADVFLNAIFYDKKAPQFFTLDEMAQPDFAIRVIADISCDIAPDASVPSTIRSSNIAVPVYGFDPLTHRELPPFEPHGIDIMAIDNLPSELPRDATVFFGRQLIDNILSDLIHEPNSPIIQRATIAADGQLTEKYAYLEDYVAVSV